MSRIIKISFEGCEVLAPNSNPITDVIEVGLDFTMSGGAKYEKAVRFIGTQNAINAIDDDGFVAIDGTTKTVVVATSEGNVDVVQNFGGTVDLYPTICVEAFITDHLGWKEAKSSDHPTNLIIDGISEPIVNEDDKALVFIK